MKRAVEFLSSRDGAATQSELWKELGLDSKRGSRVAITLEKMGVVTREKVLKDGRWTFLLRVVNNDMDLDIIIRAPCLTCENEKFCGRSAEVTPEKCDLLEKWILNDYRRRVRERAAEREKHAEEK
ncbi:TPA: transcriptional regulator [Candidatus Micrarchaeota archaeon]|nr:transcriptional regulator [Candidatus Micrarchaeota archaeon]